MPAVKINPILMQAFGEVSPIDVANETFGTIAIDLSRCATSLSKIDAEVLMDSPHGVYIGTSIEPVLNFDLEHYYSYEYFKHFQREQLRGVHVLPDIRSYEDFMATTGPIFNSYGRQVYVAHTSTKLSASPVPFFNYAAVHAAFIAIWDHFNALSRVAKPITNVHNTWLNYANYVRPEYLKKELYRYTSETPEMLRVVQQTFNYYEESEDTWSPWSNRALVEIYDTMIDPFIGRDLHRQYRLNLAGSMLYIEKGHDIRVIELQRMIWEHMEAIRHETHLGLYRP